MYANELSTEMLKDKRKSMRTSAIIHIIIIVLAILPFLKSPIPPGDFKQAILVEFKSGSSNEGSSQAAANETESSDAADEAEETSKEREVIAEAQPIETAPPTPVLTSEIEPPIITKSKVRKVDIKAPPAPVETIPQKKKVKDVPSPINETVLKPSKVKKVVITVVRPTPGGKGSGSGKGETDSTVDGGGKGSGGEESSTDGNGKEDGKGDGDKGTGDADKGDGGKGKGDGIFDGDGVLTRPIIDYPDLSNIIKESGRMSVNICVNRSGKVIYAAFNEKQSTIKDMEVIRRTLERSNEYRFEVDHTAPVKECGTLSFIIKIDS